MAMKKSKTLLGLLQVTAAILLASQASAQSQMEHPTTAVASAPASAAAQQSFALLKTLAGTWEGTMVVPGYKGPTIPLSRISMRVTSRGNAIVHEIQGARLPDDPTKYDHPVTMLYLDGGNLNLIHYCDAGNRPHMVARTSPDGKTVEFDFVDLTGPTTYGHMHHAVFTLVDANHHTEEWTYMTPGDKPMRARVELQRVADAAPTAGR
jgi:hypothetical protein